MDSKLSKEKVISEWFQRKVVVRAGSVAIAKAMMPSILLAAICLVICRRNQFLKARYPVVRKSIQIDDCRIYVPHL